jgi:hypothetical protein
VVAGGANASSASDEAAEIEPVEGPGVDGTVVHEAAEGEPPEPAETKKSSPAKRGLGYRTEK